MMVAVVLWLRAAFQLVHYHLRYAGARRPPMARQCHGGDPNSEQDGIQLTHAAHSRAKELCDQSLTPVPPVDVSTPHSTCTLRSRVVQFLLRCRCTVVCVLLASALWIYHDYGTYEVFKDELDSKWGFLLHQHNNAAGAAPVWLGEFGTNVDSLWWRYMLRYIEEKEIDFAYWPLNGQKRANSSEPDVYSLLNMDESTVRDDWKVHQLQHVINSVHGKKPHTVQPATKSGADVVV